MKMDEITRRVVESGAVLAFTDFGTGQDLWIALPLPVSTPNPNPIIATLNYSYQVGTFTLIIFKNTAANLAPAYSDFRIRVVIFPPASSRLLDGIDTRSYEQVMQAISAEAK